VFKTGQLVKAPYEGQFFPGVITAVVGKQYRVEFEDGYVALFSGSEIRARALEHLDRSVVQLMRPALQEALAEFEHCWGVSVVLGSARFSPTSCSFKLDISVVESDGTVLTPEAGYFRAHAKSHGLEPEMLGRSFTCRGNTYTITGLSIKARRYPILAVRQDGRPFKFGASTVLRGLR